MEVMWIGNDGKWCFHLSAYYCNACLHHLVYATKHKALVASGKSDIFTIIVYINRTTRQLAGSMCTYAEGELNSLTEMWMWSVHGKILLFLSMEDILVMFYCHVCFCDCFGKEMYLSITVLMFTYCCWTFSLILLYFAMWIVETQFISQTTSWVYETQLELLWCFFLEPQIFYNL